MGIDTKPSTKLNRTPAFPINYLARAQAVEEFNGNQPNDYPPGQTPIIAQTAFGGRFLSLPWPLTREAADELQENFTKSANAVETSMSVLPGGGLVTTSAHLATGQNLDGTNVTNAQVGFEVATLFLPVITGLRNLRAFGEARLLGDCELASMHLVDHFGGRMLYANIRGINSTHAYVLTPYGDIWDVIFKKNFVKPGFLSEAQVKAAGLETAIESGVFTKVEYDMACDLVGRTVSGQWDTKYILLSPRS